MTLNLAPRSSAPKGNWFTSVFVDNPMLDESKREQRKFMRYGSLTVVIILLFLAVAYIWLAIESYVSHADSTEVFSYIELTLFTFILPASIYSSISGERERATWDALILTRLTPEQIMFGKLIWRLRTVGIIAVACLIPILISRTNPDNHIITNQMLWSTQFLLLSWAILLNSFGLWVSSVTRRSITSLANIVGALIGTLIAVPGLYSLFFPPNFEESPQKSAVQRISVYDLQTAVEWIQINFAPDNIRIAINTFNPFVSINNTLTESTPPLPRFMWTDQSGFAEIATYLVLTIFFITLTYFRLRRLEEPHRS